MIELMLGLYLWLQIWDTGTWDEQPRHSCHWCEPGGRAAVELWKLQKRPNQPDTRPTARQVRANILGLINPLLSLKYNCTEWALVSILILNHTSGVVRRWNEFEKLADQKKVALESALNIQNYHLECNEIQTWMKEKTKVIESTQSLGNDLAGVMALQRKLTGMERDLEAIQVWRGCMLWLIGEGTEMIR